MMKSSNIIIVIASIIFVAVATVFFSTAHAPSKPLPTTPSAISTTIPTATAQSSASKQKIKIFLVALEDNGDSGTKIGCGDSIVAVEKEIDSTPSPLRAAFVELLSLKEKQDKSSNLYNALADSNLTFLSAVIQLGKATIKLSGTVSLGGVCDMPRFEEQLKQTALQFPTIKQVDIYINDQPIKEVLSQK